MPPLTCSSAAQPAAELVELIQSLVADPYLPGLAAVVDRDRKPEHVSASRTGHKLVVKHLPDHPFLLSEDLHRRMTARFEREITLWDAVAGAHLIVIATFGVAPNGVTAVEELALMVVTETWIPIEHIYDANLVNALTDQRRRFIKALRYNLPPSRPLAAAVLLDTLPSPVALYVVPPGAEPEGLGALEPLVAETPLPAWVWTAGQGPMPAFPERELLRDARR